MKRTATWSEIIETLGGIAAIVWFLGRGQYIAALVCMVLIVLMDRLPKKEQKTKCAPY